jgi:predicted SprT family Zn-dependent metalloprotease
MAVKKLHELSTEQLTLMVDSTDDVRLYASIIIELAYREFPITNRPVIEWCTSTRITAGTAHFLENKIKLCAELLTEIERVHITALHEYAHLLAFYRYGLDGVGHGWRWKQAMRDLGQSPRRYHSWQGRRNKRRFFVIYQCLSCNHEIVKCRLFAKGRHYTHVRCGGSFVFIRRLKVG